VAEIHIFDDFSTPPAKKVKTAPTPNQTMSDITSDTLKRRRKRDPTLKDSLSSFVSPSESKYNTYVQLIQN
jgi:hypothetical protein